MSKLFLDVGACIYCGDRRQPLTREHVLPRGLGGNEAPEGLADALVLRSASCKYCQEVTKRIEEVCLVSMMGPGRARLGLRRKDRASEKTKALLERTDGVSEHIEAPWDKVPGAIAIPSFYEAPILSGAPVTESPSSDYVFRVLAPALSVPEDVRRIGVSLDADSRMFARMLAKIGLGVAVAHLGTEGYEPLVRNLILKGSESPRVSWRLFGLS